jgi:hypothetical protein
LHRSDCLQSLEFRSRVAGHRLESKCYQPPEGYGIPARAQPLPQLICDYEPAFARTT